nr:MAG TPA: hypothetical protein [Caudoviricetes sp.]
MNLKMLELFSEKKILQQAILLSLIVLLLKD